LADFELPRVLCEVTVGDDSASSKLQLQLFPELERQVLMHMFGIGNVFLFLDLNLPRLWLDHMTHAAACLHKE
jgi:hypothetical protein